MFTSVFLILGYINNKDFSIWGMVQKNFLHKIGSYLSFLNGQVVEFDSSFVFCISYQAN